MCTHLIVNTTGQVHCDGSMLQSSGDVVYPFCLKQFYHLVWSAVRRNIDVFRRISQQQITNDPAHQSKVEAIRFEDGLESQ